MTPWRVVIADDEPLARRGVRQLLARHKAFEVVRECRDGIEASAALERGEADLVFLDIAMPGLDGVEVARRHGEARGAVIVFLTAHSKHAVDAFEADATDYLVKPVSAARFARTMERVTARLQARITGSRLPSLMARTRSGVVVLPAAEIDRIEGANHYARVWYRGNRYLVRETLDALEHRLAGAGFLRIHRGALIRLAAVERLGSGAAGQPVVVLRSGVSLAVARRRMVQLTRALRQASGLPEG
jgi:DNA-binding LytR/AlgR family response regulator